MDKVPLFRGYADYYFDWLEHNKDDEYWNRIKIEKYYSSIV
ncbi:MAG: hypothetical protein QXX95_03340 [Nitrososphaerales archaeon]